MCVGKIKPEKFTVFEWDQLCAIGGSVYGDGTPPYWWGRKTMPKLAARGLVMSHPKFPKAWCITASGLSILRGN